jgi:hypothetical protein
MARMNGLEPRQAGWYTRLVYWFVRRNIGKLTGSADGSVLVWDWAEAGKPRKQDRPNVIFIR